MAYQSLVRPQLHTLCVFLVPEVVYSSRLLEQAKQLLSVHTVK